MLKRSLVLGLLMILITCTSALAQVSITYSTQGKKYFSMTIPDNWRVNVGSEIDPALMPDNERPMARLITAMPDDNTPLWFGMWVPADVKNFAEAKEYMDSLGIELLTDVVVTERRHDRLNTMQVYYVSGNGKKDDELMEFHGGFVQISGENVAIAIYIGPHDLAKQHKDELKRMFQSLQPVNP